MSMRRHIVWSAAQHQLAHERLPTNPHPAFAVKALQLGQVIDRIRVLHAQPLLEGSRVNRSALMRLAHAYAARDRLRPGAEPARVLLRFALKHAWARVRIEQIRARISKAGGGR